jgi:hypothetical protein
MKTTYNRIAGQSAERIAAPSDGIFAPPMTLLARPAWSAKEAIRSEQGLCQGSARCRLK